MGEKKLKEVYMYVYLKEKNVYEDRYDLGTIEDCLKIIEYWGRKDREESLEESKKEGGIRLIVMGKEIQLYHVKGERYRNRETRIREWMDEDRKKDEFYRNAKEPEKISCLKCLVKMKVIAKDDLYEYQKPLRVLFMFECPKCEKRRGVYDNGDEFKVTPDYCPKCSKEIDHSFKFEGNLSIWERHCPACGFNDRETEDRLESQEKRKALELRDKQLLEQHRLEFCLTPDEGMEYILQSQRLQAFADSIKRDHEKKSDPQYPKVQSLVKLGIVELEKLLLSELKKHKYIKLSLSQPEIAKFVIVSFTIQDADSARIARDSEYKLRKLLKKILVGTNWRLMTEGVSYRLGYLSGRLKGYDNEDDLLEVVKSDK